jgi:soluble lytic murein transglycosylase-like protein
MRRASVILATLAAVLCAAQALAWGDIPAQAGRYRELVRRVAVREDGPNAPVALYAAQLAQESGWNPQAVSPVGARGLAQFMPGTARDVARQRPDLGPALPTNPVWAVRAMVYYDLRNLGRIEARTPTDRWALALCAYNGGLNWVFRDQSLARRIGLDPGCVESVSQVNAGRSAAAKRENDGYWRRIMLRLMPAYEAAGWGRGVRDE